MRLDEHVILRSPQITNPLGERELDLRGNGIALLDEAPLLQLEDSFDVVDLTDNNLTSIEYLPEMKRLTTIIAHRNRLQRVSLSAALRLPNLHTFVADDNAFSNLDQLIVFSKLRALERISLGGSNPVSRHEHFRTFLIFLCPKLKLINFQRVLLAEREASKASTPVFEGIVRNASGAAAMSLNVESDVKVQRKRGRSAKAAAAVSNGGASSAGDGGNVTLGGGVHAEQEAVLDQRIADLQSKIDAAETEDEMSALMEEMEALQDALDRRRVRRK